MNEMAEKIRRNEANFVDRIWANFEVRRYIVEVARLRILGQQLKIVQKKIRLYSNHKYCIP